LSDKEEKPGRKISKGNEGLGFKVGRDGILMLHPDFGADVSGDSIKIPSVDTKYGAGFGDTITDLDRAFAAEREPTAHFLTFGVAADITDKWFTVNDPDTEEADPALDRTVQDVLVNLKFKKHLTEALESERIYGSSLIVGGFNDAKTINQLSQPLRSGSQLLQLAVYPSTKNGQKIKEVEVTEKDEDENSERFGEPKIYKLNRGGNSFLYVHYTRVCPVETRSNKASVLDPIWDDLCCGRNIRWGAGQWMYRTGGGFPVVGFPEGTTPEQLETYHDSAAFRNLMSRTAIFVAQNSKMENDGMTFTFEGTAGHALDPTPFFQTNVEQIAIATGIPKDKLIGAQAGAVVGSETNVEHYYKVISREQSKLDSVVRWVIDKLTESGQITLIKVAIDKTVDSYHVKLLKNMLRRVTRRDYRHRTAKNYVVEWNSGFELIDEVRADENLDPLKNGEGAKLKSRGMEEQGEGYFVKRMGGKKEEQGAESDHTDH